MNCNISEDDRSDVDHSPSEMRKPCLLPGLDMDYFLGFLRSACSHLSVTLHCLISWHTFLFAWFAKRFCVKFPQSMSSRHALEYLLCERLIGNNVLLASSALAESFRRGYKLADRGRISISMHGADLRWVWQKVAFFLERSNMF